MAMVLTVSMSMSVTSRPTVKTGAMNTLVVSILLVDTTVLVLMDFMVMVTYVSIPMNAVTPMKLVPSIMSPIFCSPLMNVTQMPLVQIQKVSTTVHVMMVIREMVLNVPIPMNVAILLQ